MPKIIKIRDSNRYLYINVHGSIIQNRQKMKTTRVHPQTKDNKMCYMPTMDYYSSVKRNEILTHAATWINLENAMLSEISHTQMDKYCMNPLI